MTARDSFMNAHARNLPNDWDRQAVLVAFQRPPGNQPPDRDPDGYSANATSAVEAGTLTWGPPRP